LVRRYLENESNGILATAKASGAALIQSNLTTIIGFGALMASSFAPLAEMGLVTSLGVALALAGGLWLVPAVILLGEATVRGIEGSYRYSLLLQRENVVLTATRLCHPLSIK